MNFGQKLFLKIDLTNQSIYYLKQNSNITFSSTPCPLIYISWWLVIQKFSIFVYTKPAQRIFNVTMYTIVPNNHSSFIKEPYKRTYQAAWSTELLLYKASLFNTHYVLNFIIPAQKPPIWFLMYIVMNLYKDSKIW